MTKVHKSMNILNQWTQKYKHAVIKETYMPDDTDMLSLTTIAKYYDIARIAIGIDHQLDLL